MEQVADRD